ncbi:hypothetical protein GN956_G8942 [Arapaima gigas]
MSEAAVVYIHTHTEVHTHLAAVTARKLVPHPAESLRSRIRSQTPAGLPSRVSPSFAGHGDTYEEEREDCEVRLSVERRPSSAPHHRTDGQGSSAGGTRACSAPPSVTANTACQRTAAARARSLRRKVANGHQSEPDAEEEAHRDRVERGSLLVPTFTFYAILDPLVRGRKASWYTDSRTPGRR